MFSSVGVEHALCASLEGLLLVSREQTPKLYIVIAVFKIYTPSFLLIAHQFIRIIQFPSSLVLRNSTQLPAFQSCSKELRFKSLIVNKTDVTAIFWFSVIYIAM